MQKSIRNRLLKSFSLMVVLPVLAIFILVNVIYLVNTSRTITAQGKTIVLEIEDSIKSQFGRYAALLSFLERDTTIVEYSTYNNAAGISPTLTLHLQTLLDGYSHSIDGIEHLSVLYQNGAFVCTDVRMLHPSIAENADWYEPCMADPDRIFYISYPSGKNPMLINTPHFTSSLSICRAIKNELGQPVAVANLTLRGETLGSLLTSSYSQQGGQSYLATPDNTLVNSPLRLENLIGYDSRRYLITRQKIEDLPLTIINILPTSQFYTMQYNLLLIMVISLIGFILFFISHLRYTSRQIVNPIEELRRLMHEAQHGNLKVAFHPDTDDEFDDLADSFNQMVSEIRRLIVQVYNEQVNKRKAEIAALQANIKPHFLYNTLDTIHWMARRYGADDIVEAVDALSDLFRAGFSNNHELGTVAHEFIHIESYLKIQKLRYNDILDYELRLEPVVRELPVQKTILQPVVENALYHGIKESGRAGKIVIAAGLDDGDLLLSIQDNGRGMDEAELTRLRLKLESGPGPKDKQGMGLYNVQQRLRLSYGPRFGLSIESSPDEGTLVKLRHPVLTHEQLEAANRDNSTGTIDRIDLTGQRTAEKEKI